MSDNARKAAAYVNLVLAEDIDRLWPEDERALKEALRVLNGLVNGRKR